jgi:hypothetical protein
LEEQKADVRAAEKAFDDLQSRYNRLEWHSTDLAQRYKAQVNYTQKLEAELVEPAPKKDTPWYPAQLTGYGRWIEGPPPSWMPAGSFQPLAPQERDGKTFYAVRGDYDATEYQHCVAHCIRMDVLT